MSLPRFSVGRKVMVSMIFLAIAVLGLASYSKLNLDMFPNIEPPMLSLMTIWKGASAIDIEQKVTKPLEDVLATTPDLDEMQSTSKDNVSLIQLKFSWGANLDEAANQVRSLISQAKPNMPDDVDEPILIRINLSQLPILIFGVTTALGRADEYTDFIEDYIINDLQRVPGVATVISFNPRKKQLLVEVDREKLDAYNISIEQVAQALRMNNLSLPAGTLEMGRSVYTIRAPLEFQTPEDVENVIVSASRGSFVLVKDIAKVGFAMEDKVADAEMDKRPSLLLMAQRKSGANTVLVARALKERINRLNEELAPKGFKIHILMDMSRNIVNIIGTLTETVYVAAILVVVIVFLFLRRVRSSLIVAVSLPTSLIAAFALLFAGGYTLNIVTLSALAIAIGLVVDDSIVVVDNIVRHLDQGEDATTAAIVGGEEVSSAVAAATFTNASIFFPIIFVGGMIGVMFKELAYVVITTLLMSLLVALMLVPVLAQRFLRRAGREGAFTRFSEKAFSHLESAYGNMISWALGHRRAVVFGAVVVFLGSFGLLRFIGVDFMPKSDGAMVMVTAELPIGTNMEYSMEVGRRIADLMRQEIPEATMIGVRAGSNPMSALMGQKQGDNITIVTAIVPSLSERKRTTFEMAEAIRPKILAIAPEIVSLDIAGENPMTSLVSGGTKPLTVEIYSRLGSLEQLRRAAKVILDEAKQVRGVINPTTDLMEDNKEMHLAVNRLEAQRLGVPMASVAMAIRTSLYGQEVGRYRGGDEDLPLFLRLEDEDRKKDPQAILSLNVPSLTGSLVKISAVGNVSEGQSPIEIRRLDKQRLIRVMADTSGRALSEVASELEQRIAQKRAEGIISDDIFVKFTGQVKEQREMLVNLTLALIVATLLVFMVMSAQFESLLDPLVIMFSVPFGISGSLLALLLTGVTLSSTSFIGMIIQVGLVVKNAIVLVDYINLMRSKGLSLFDAVKVGGQRRLRPVLMTALAIILGMVPLALSRGEGHEQWTPMAITVIGGVAFSTLVTLVLIPTVYVLTDRFRKRWAKEAQANA